MTPAAVLLALAASAPPPLALTVSAERIALPAAAAPARLEARPLEHRVALRVPAAATAALARRLRGASRLCPAVDAAPGEVVLRCTARWVRAAVVEGLPGPTLDLFELSVPPWRPEEEGPPLVPFDGAALGLGPCPGERPATRGECALAAGDLAAARAAFEEALAAGPSAHAQLRLGDLDLREDRPDAAVERWRRARAEAPWGRLAAERLCELEPGCLAAGGRAAVFDALAVERPLRADLVLRRIRLRALAGDLAGAARAVAEDSRPAGACAGAAAWCRHVLLVALRQPGADGAAALAAYLEVPGRGEGPLALELARAAADRALQAGAPRFAAAVLAGQTGRVPRDELSDHLRRVVELYGAAGDAVRGREVARFARTRLPEAELARAPWRTALAALRPSAPPAPRPAPARPPAPADDGDLRAARAAVEAARLGAAPATRP
ncbi:conserved hypothetical protein [Anaeromyxobacter sp. K]|uniref:hypothetical protein n=1 Tax=Anaeromyxobacter sp. (strain K) TaxID=447217 RepID=UPI00017BE182|nr:hypothetical protein [Anaeromyxobacter sp. K]ACG73685.1 conserved hypothetical protein [Anaeromyxobacter sp. K]